MAPDFPPSAPEDSIDFADGPLSPGESTDDSDDESPIASPLTQPADNNRLPSLSGRVTSSNMTSSSTPLGLLASQRAPAGVQSLAPSVLEKMQKFHLSRQGPPPARPQMGQSVSAGSGPILSQPVMQNAAIAGLPAGLNLPNAMRPIAHNFNSAPAVPQKPSLSARRKLAFQGKLPMGPISGDTGSMNTGAAVNDKPETAFSQFSHIIDTDKGELHFDGKVKISSTGVVFTNGAAFEMSLDQIVKLGTLGKGNYGTVYKVRRGRNVLRRPGLGLGGDIQIPSEASEQNSGIDPATEEDGPQIMAMKEMQLQLDAKRLESIVTELDILHRCRSPFIIDFYGAFFQEGSVYVAIEYMDGGSIDNIYAGGVPENVLRKMVYATVQGLKSLKDDHKIIHRDVKPTNILVNTRGQVKICDFGVSGNLIASVAKTNIGCQSYMAPERIRGGGLTQAGTAADGDGTYGVQSDVWSLGMSIIECALGRYPYPEAVSMNIMTQLNAIVLDDPPELPEEGFSDASRIFVKSCLNKLANLRPTYAALLNQTWLADLSKPLAISEEEEDEAEINAETSYTGGVGERKVMGVGRGTEDAEVGEWVKGALERKANGTYETAQPKPATHAAPLDVPLGAFTPTEPSV